VVPIQADHAVGVCIVVGALRRAFLLEAIDVDPFPILNSAFRFGRVLDQYHVCATSGMGCLSTFATTNLTCHKNTLASAAARVTAILLKATDTVPGPFLHRGVSSKCFTQGNPWDRRRTVDNRLHGKGNSTLPWRKAGQPRHLVDVVDSDQ